MTDRLFAVDALRVAVVDQDTAVRGDRVPPVTDDGLALAPGWVEVIPRASFGVDAGEVLALIGESASGKSLTLLGAFGLLPEGARAIGGTTTFDGKRFLPAGAPLPEDDDATNPNPRS